MRLKILPSEEIHRLIFGGFQLSERERERESEGAAD